MAILKNSVSAAICALCILLLGCAPNMKTQMSGYALQISENAKPITNAVVVDAANVGFSHTKTGNTAIPPNIGHDMAGIHQQYAKSVAQ